jgi:iron complex transport system ATP-binding protein
VNVPTIEIRELSLGYRDRRHRKVIAHGLNATVYSGELTCLLGVNGIGKSTLLRTMVGFQPPLGGEVRIAGRSLSDYSERERARQIGIVLTEALTSDLTVSEVVGMGRNPYTGFWGNLRKDDRRIVRQALETIRIAELADRSVLTLSDGERQKTMIAKAIAQQTPIILLDEPTAFLDYPSKVELLQLLKQLCREQNKTIFLTIHDWELAEKLSDRIWRMDASGLF